MRPDVRLLALRELGVREALVVTEVEIGLGAVVGDEDLAVLERAHGSRVDVEVRIEFLQRHPQPAAFQQTADGCRRDAFTKRRNHAPRDEYVLGAWHRVLVHFDNDGSKSAATLSRSSRRVDAEGFIFGFHYADAIAIFERAQLLQTARPARGDPPEDRSRQAGNRAGTRKVRCAYSERLAPPSR